jgi:glutathione synthase
MKIGILVNDIETEKSNYTTIRLAMTATNFGHQVWLFSISDLAYDLDDLIKARARTVTGKKYKSSEIYFKDLLGKNKILQKKISVDELDVLLLRNNPSDEPPERAWARTLGIEFGRIAIRHGVLVLNDPNGLSNAASKMYLQQFPKEIRPKTIITRNRDEILEFSKNNKKVVLKPLSGSGGRNVFLTSKKDSGNFNQIVDAISKDGYIMVQEYIPQAADGDIRLFLMNGVPMQYNGKYAAFKKVNKNGDVRNNIHVGGKIERVKVDRNILRIAEMVRPKLVQDGMFFVGLDIAGNKVLEVNVFSPGGLGTARKLENVKFTHPYLKALERKVEYMKFYKRKFNNVEIATL